MQLAQSVSTSSPDFRGSDPGVKISQQSSETSEHGGGPEGQTTEHLPRSTSTKSPDVLNLAKRWIEECANQESGHTNCRPIPELAQARYPTRLLDLRDMIEYKQKEQKRHEDPYIPPKLRRSDTYLEDLAERRLQEAKDLLVEKSAQKIYLVSQREGAGERRSGKQKIGGRYVTLSHCWGKADFIKLTAKNIEKWQDGMHVVNLPQTFQDAIEFACQLDNVRYIWIDALCIIQGDEKDWLAQSALMHEVYMHSYCNISATAAADSTKGLFFGRNPSTLWYGEVSVRLEDDLRGNKGILIRCKIFDLSFWEEIVDHAPVNRRSWVFQERLLAPRVIHWCKDQIAFECRETDRAECLPLGLPHYQRKGSNIIEEPKLKCIDVQTGKQLRELRLEDEGNSAAPTIEDRSLYLYEIWKRWVETYSKMAISYHRDRLIALSGIAAMMTSVLKEHGSEDEYIAGMWRKHMASQLLWHVNEGNGLARQPFENTRPKDHKVSTKEIYRAPSFSWASVETPRGVSFPETTDKEMLITVDVVRLTHVEGSDDSGLLTDGYVVIRGFLRKIELIDTEASRKALVSILMPVRDVDILLTAPDPLTQVARQNIDRFWRRLPSSLHESSYGCRLSAAETVCDHVSDCGLGSTELNPRHSLLCVSPRGCDAQSTKTSRTQGTKPLQMVSHQRWQARQDLGGAVVGQPRKSTFHFRSASPCVLCAGCKAERGIDLSATAISLGGRLWSQIQTNRLSESIDDVWRRRRHLEATWGW